MNTLFLGAKIKSLRKRKGMTQRELADAIPISFSTFRRWENNEHSPSLKEISRIAEVLNVNANEFIESNSNPENKSIEKITSLVPETNDANYPSMSYWGGIIDNIRKVIMRGDINEISLIYPLLKSGCDMLAQVQDATRISDINSPHVDIQQNNFGRDATVNFGATSTGIKG